MTDLLTLQGIGQRVESFRFELLDPFNSRIGDLDVDATSPPTVSNSINRTVKRQLSGLRLAPSVTAEIDTLTDRVKPWARYPGGVEYPLGVFLFSDASRRPELSGSAVLTPTGYAATTEGTLLDQLATLDQGSRGINFYHVGHSIYDALIQQMEAGGVMDYEIDHTDAQVVSPTVWRPNAKRLTVINDLCKMGGYYSLFFDNNGAGQLRQVPAMESVEPTLEYAAGLNVVLGSIVESDDLLEAPNTYVVVNSAFTDRPIWGEWLVPADAPHSVQKRRFHVVKELDIQGIESSAAARKAAKAHGQADYATYRWVNFDSATNPLHDTFTIVSWLGDKYREQAWDITCRPGADMSHELRRVWSDEVADFLEEAA